MQFVFSLTVICFQFTFQIDCLNQLAFNCIVQINHFVKKLLPFIQMEQLCNYLVLLFDPQISGFFFFFFSFLRPALNIYGSSQARVCFCLFVCLFFQDFLFYFLFYLFYYSDEFTHLQLYNDHNNPVSQDRLGVELGAAAASLHHSHSNTRSNPCLQPTPQLTAMWDP